MASEHRKGVSDSLCTFQTDGPSGIIFKTILLNDYLLFQCCVDNYCPAKWIIYIVYLSSFVISTLLSGVIEHWVGSCMLFSGFSLITYFAIVSLEYYMQFSLLVHLIHLSPQRYIVYSCVSLFCFCFYKIRSLIR